MRVIVDSNIIMSALIRAGKTREILTSPLIEFYTIDFAITEIRKYKKLLIEKSDFKSMKRLYIRKNNFELCFLINILSLRSQSY